MKCADLKDGFIRVPLIRDENNPMSCVAFIIGDNDDFAERGRQRHREWKRMIKKPKA